MNISSSPSPSPQRIPGSLAERALDSFPSGSYALSALLRVLDIVESTEVPTAAVECRIQPRLLLNPDFVAEHAPTSEKLLVLVMHELHHVLLGHTTLFPRNTPVRNFVFDAVINGIVCRMFPGADYTSFLTDYYDEGSFPECLLRPPPGWPDKTETARGILALPELKRGSVKDVHEALYSAGGASYAEVYETLPKILSDPAIKAIPLLGGHGEEDEPPGELKHRAPILFDIVRGIVEQWPQPPDPIRGRSLAEVLRPTQVRAKSVPSNRAVLRGLILKVAGFSGTGATRRLRAEKVEVPTPIPSLNRRSLVLRALGSRPLLHPGPVTWRRTIRSGERVHVYIDVSGSMDSVKGPLYGAVLDCQELVHPTVHLFSTKIADITLAELRGGVCKSTGGTAIACVAEHMDANRVRRALLVTDGYVGIPGGRHRDVLSKAKLAVAFIGGTTCTTDLAKLADFAAPLTSGV